MLAPLNMESVEVVFRRMLEISEGADMLSGMLSGIEGGVVIGIGSSTESLEWTGMGTFRDSFSGLTGVSTANDPCDRLLTNGLNVAGLIGDSV